MKTVCLNRIFLAFSLSGTFLRNKICSYVHFKQSPNTKWEEKRLFSLQYFYGKKYWKIEIKACIFSEKVILCKKKTNFLHLPRVSNHENESTLTKAPKQELIIIMKVLGYVQCSKFV